MADAAELLQVIAGPDPRDSCLKRTFPITPLPGSTDQGVEGGIIRECFDADGLT